MEPAKIFQPIHPEIRDRLDPEYVKVHDEILQYIQPTEDQPWNPSSRTRPSPTAHCGIKNVEIGSVQDVDLGTFQARIFIPDGNAPAKGWPMLMWLHGGGWVMGGLNSENGFLRHICKYVRCAVITVNYRHAPEYKYPTAIEDSYSGLLWLLENASKLGLDTSRLALGGLSAGAGLAAILSMKAALSEAISIQPVFQLLICPVIDCTATEATTWAATKYSPWLTPSRMTWYRNQYFVNARDTSNWQASPCFAVPSTLAKSPKTFLAIAECDLLSQEALSYGESLKKNGVDTTVEVYKGATHSVLILAGMRTIGQKLVHDACAALATALDLDYDPHSSPILAQGK